MSGSASGTFGGLLVFLRLRGKDVVREHVIPRNPQTQAQMDVRNAQTAVAKIAAVVRTLTKKGAGRLVTDKEAIKAITPSEMGWNAYLSQQFIGTSMINFDAAVAAWEANSANAAAWETSADGIPVLDIVQRGEGGIAATPMSPGKAWFLYQYALFIMDIATAVPGAVPPTYA